MGLDVVTVFAFLLALQQLNLGLEFEKYLAASDNIPTRLPTPLHHLQVLEMPNIFLDSLQEAQFLLCLHELPQLAPAHHSRQDRPGLQVVVELMRFVLAKAPHLPRVNFPLCHTTRLCIGVPFSVPARQIPTEPPDGVSCILIHQMRR
ncbi:unnamed protein product [Linum tenue]|nr:unnamed protein product [Linum tenue]